MANYSRGTGFLTSQTYKGGGPLNYGSGPVFSYGEKSWEGDPFLQLRSWRSRPYKVTQPGVSHLFRPPPPHLTTPTATRQHHQVRNSHVINTSADYAREAHSVLTPVPTCMVIITILARYRLNFRFFVIEAPGPMPRPGRRPLPLSLPTTR